MLARLRLLLCMAWLLWPGGVLAAANEEQVRAAFVASFGSYVEWPEGAFADAQAPFVIGVLGDTAMRRLLEAGVGGRRIQGRPVEVRAVDDLREAGRVHLLYLRSGSLTPRQLASLPVLTVGDGAAFLEQGGVIRLLMQEQRLRFEFNPKAAERAGLKVSARLQQLALNAYEEAH